MKIEIQKEEDRLTVASILIKNGYTVKQSKEKSNKGNLYQHFLEVEK